MITIVEPQPQPQPDPVAAIAQISDATERARALRQLCLEYGVGLSAELIITNGRAWKSLIAALMRDRGPILRLLPDAMIISEPWRVVGPVLDTPPGPAETVRIVIDSGVSQHPWIQTSKAEWIEVALKEAAALHWSAEELERAKAKLEELFQPGDTIASASNQRIILRRRDGSYDGQMIEVARQ
jgi:hypothetical protein